MSLETLEGLRSHYAGMLELLSNAAVRFEELTTTARSRYFGMTRAEFEAALSEDRDHLDQSVALAAAIELEGLIRRDAKFRENRKLKSPPTGKSFRDLYSKFSVRVRLEELLDLWKRAGAGNASLFARLGKLRKQRHWAAHGRYWTLQVGTPLTPYEAFTCVEDFVTAARQVDPNFPRS